MIGGATGQGRWTQSLSGPALCASASALHFLFLALIGGAALALRVIPWLARYPLHPDEALYGVWAKLVISGRDPLLLAAWVDKPPLVIYALAGSLAAFGASETALRLPGMIASLLLIPLTYGFARGLHGPRTGLIAAALVAISPFAVLFSPTAFTDPFLTVWLVAAAWAAWSGRAWWAGLALGLAIASKQQGVLGIPLAAGLLVLRTSAGHAPGSGEAPGKNGLVVKRLLLAALGTAAVVAPVTWWDSLRWATRPSFWDRSLTTYGGLGLAPLSQWPQRGREWTTVLGCLFGLPLLSAGLLALAGGAGVSAARRIRAYRQGFRQAADPAGSARDALAGDAGDLMLVLYAAGYLALHFCLTFQPWDRYLLPLVPLLSIPAAHGLRLAWKRRSAWVGPSQQGSRWLQGSAGILGRVQGGIDIRRRSRTGWERGFRPLSGLAGIAIAALLAYAAWLGAAGRLPVGSDHGAYAGLERAAAVLAAQPVDAVIYQRGLGWHLDFYLFAAPQERRWWSDDDKLASDIAEVAAREPARPQMLLASASEAASTESARPVLARRGVALAEVEHFDGRDGRQTFTLYRVTRLAGESTP